MALPPIRPDLAPPRAATGPASDPARLAAQRAFFDAALGRAGAPTQARPATAASVSAPAPTAVQASSRLPDPAADAPARPLRPGSLLDIRV